MKTRQRMEERSAIYNLKMLIVLGFILCAITFFVVGLIYGQSFDSTILVSLLIVICAVNAACVWYILHKFKALIEP